MPTSAPGIVVADPWLEPYADHITQRMERCTDRLAEIRKDAGSLRDYATWHLEMGIHRGPDGWTVREWAPEAKSVSLMGEFNAWNPSSHPLEPAGDGCWAPTLPADTLDHGQLVKLLRAATALDFKDRPTPLEFGKAFAELI